ncbi:MAG: RNA polymerase sigma factor [Solirubrobacterales bacterium]
MEGRRGGAVLTLPAHGGERRLDPEAAGDHIDTLFRVAVAMSGSRDLAEDLVQQTYVKVLSKPRLLRRDDDLGYLIKALRNTWYSHLRRERTRREATDPGVEPEELAAPGAAGDPVASLEATAVLDALAQLPQPYREAVAAVDIAGLSYAEAARALGVRQGTIMSRLYRGREQVAEAVGAG